MAVYMMKYRNVVYLLGVAILVSALVLMCFIADIPYSGKRWRWKTLVNPQNKQLANKTLANEHNSLLVR